MEVCPDFRCVCLITNARPSAAPPHSCLLVFFLSQIVHGGVTALTFDNLFGMALFMANAGAVFTAFIKVRKECQPNNVYGSVGECLL